MNIFDIMGPVMVGPSSVHTAGAVRMGLVGRKLLGFQPARANIALHPSFAAAGAGHGADKAIVAGLLAMKPDDPDIPRSFQLAEESRLSVQFQNADLQDAPPNTVVMTLIGERGRIVVVTATSIGDGRIWINSIDGMHVSFTADIPTLVIRLEDRPGIVSAASSCLVQHGVNIEGFQHYRHRRNDLAQGDISVMVIESLQPIEQQVMDDLMLLPGVVRNIYLDQEEG